MLSMMGSEYQKSKDSGPSGPRALWPVDLKLTHLDWNPEATLIHFQAQYLSICELDYNILQGEIQNIPKTKTAVNIGEFCLVEDLTSARWYRGRVQNRKEDLFDVFLIDHGNVLSVDIDRVSSCSNDLFILPPKIVCGFLANVLMLHGFSSSVVDDYLSCLIGKNVTGYIQALLPHKVLLLEAPDINENLVRHGFGRHVDTDTFLLLAEMLTEVPLKQNIDPVPDLLIEKQRGQEYCFKSGLQGYEEILSFCGPKLSCGTRAKVRVTAAVNPGLLYCQMVSMETDLREMSKKLADVFEYRTKDHHYKTPENLGLLCSVKGKDGNWYRGFVQFLPVNSQVRVLFIDYGFIESVKVENVHRLPPDFYTAPIMAFPCSLSALNVQDEAVKTQQLSFLKAGLLGEVLDVEISHFEEKQHLYSITVFSAQDNHVKEPESVQELPRKKVQSDFETEEVSAQGGYLFCDTIIGEALDKTLEEEEVQEGSVFVGYVEHIQNPNHFWIRTQKRNNEFEEMMTQLADHFSDVKLDEDTLVNPDLGTMCCAVYEEDMHFYRGVVIDTLEHGAEVLFVDFGNIEKVPHMLIKKIPETFSSKSAFAICCSLANVVPLDEVWTSTATDFFRRAVSNKAMLLHVVQMRKNKFVVDLFEMGSDNSPTISELLISSKQAEYWNSIRIGAMVQNKTEVTEKTTRSLRYCVTPDISENTEWDDLGQNENTGQNEIKKVQVATSFKALSIKPGCEFAVCCSFIISPSEFWCRPLEKVLALEELMSKIQQYYKTHTVPLQSGDSCCVANSPLDGIWYRAFITHRQKYHVRVILVDYGITIQLKEHNLQTIMPEFVDLEGQAFRCSLYNLIEPVETKSCGGWNPEVCNSLKAFSNSPGHLRCKVVSQLSVKNKELYNVVDLYNTQTRQSITKVLVKQGLAREATLSTKQLSTVSPESFVYSSFDLDIKSQEKTYVTHVSNHCEVYCHLERNTELIEELEEKILEESEKMKQASRRAVVRKLCLAKYLDGIWYRGLAHPVESPLHLSVFFVDYGNTIISEKTHVMFIRRDSADLLYTPVQAVKFNLASVSKEEHYAYVKEWLDGAILNKQVRAVIVGKSDDGSFDVELYDGEVNINEKVKEIIVSCSPKPQTVVSLNASSTKTKCKCTHHKTGMRTPVKSKSQLKERSSHSPRSIVQRGVGSSLYKRKEKNKKTYVKAQNSKVKNLTELNDTNTKNTESCIPHKHTPVKQQREHHDAKTEQPEHTEETEIPQLSFLPDIKVSMGFRAKCFVSHIDSVDRFFLQLSEDEPAILKMGEDLSSGVSRESLKTTPSLRINDLVLAEYEEDGALYRSVVKDHEGTCYTVEFVDYGNSAVIGKEKIYSIPQEYLSQPRLSISCSLLDTSTYKNDTSFIDAVMEKPLMVDFIRQYGTHWQVKVEVLGEAVGLPTALEAAVETSAATKKGEEASSSSSEIDEKVRSCEQTSLTVRDEETRSESEARTVEGEKLSLKPPPVSLSTKLKVKSCRGYNKKNTRNKSYSKKIQRKTSNSPVKVKNDCAEKVITSIVQAKDTENGVVLSVLSNGRFYVRLNKTSDKLAALESRIAVNLHRCDIVAEEDMKQGLKCLVQVDKDSQWKRAVVQHVGQDKCQVLLVDHGLTEEIPTGSIRRQCSDMTKIPNLAVLCKMNCLGFSQGGDANKWEILKPMIDQEVKLVFVHYSKVDKLWMVEIVINGLFLNNHITSITSLAETQNMAAEELTLVTSPRQLTFAPIHIDKAYSGIAAAVATPFEFCVVLEDLLLVMNKVSVMLGDLPGKMPPLPEAHLIPGACCMLKSDTKNKWCRAEIIHADTTIVLNLADYGHCECVPYDDISKLKKLPDELIKLPKMTYPCILRGVKPVGLDGEWTDEAAVFFQQCLYQRNLQIYFREFVSNTNWKVDVLANGIHVAKELVDAGHAGYVDVMLGLRFQEQSLSKACPPAPDSEEECGPDDEGLDRNSDLSSDVDDEAEGKMAPDIESGSSLLM
ncbi:tudor domain-containing protein 15 [Scomber scombrus]